MRSPASSSRVLEKKPNASCAPRIRPVMTGIKDAVKATRTRQYRLFVDAFANFTHKAPSSVAPPFPPNAEPIVPEAGHVSVCSVAQVTPSLLDSITIVLPHRLCP